MNRRLIGVIFIGIVFLALGSAGYASTTLAIQGAPAYANQDNDIVFNFIATNPDFDGQIQLDTYKYYLSTDATLETGSDTEFSPTQFPTPSGELTTGKTFSGVKLDLSSQSDGTYYLFVEITITPPLASESSPSHQIILDKTNPVIAPLVFNPIPFTGWSKIPIQVTSSCNETPCIMEYQIGSGTLTAFTSPLTLSTANGTITLKATDAAGNTSTLTSTETLQIDTNAPTGFSINATTSYTNDATPDITINATDAGVGGMKAYVKCEGTTAGTELSMSGSSLVVNNFDITTGPNCITSNGDKILKILVKDAFDFETEEKSLTLKYDATPPDTVTSLSITSTGSDQISLDWPAPSDSGGSGINNYDVYRGTTNSIPGSALTSTSDSSYTNTGLSSCTTYYYWVKARDNAGNVGPASSALEAKTSGCSDTDPDDDPPIDDNDGDVISCNVTPTYTNTALYAGETVIIKVTTSTSQVWTLRANIPGKSGTQELKSGTGKEASASLNVPNQVGKSIDIFYKYQSGSCGAPKKTYVIKDPATKTSDGVSDGDNTGSGSDEEGSSPPPILGTTTPVEPVTQTISFSPDQIPALLASAGFNAENTQLKESMASFLVQWNVLKTITVVPSAENGKYSLRMIISLQNTGNQGTIKLIEEIPKEFASLASELESDYPMTTLKDDPLIQFELKDLYEGQMVEIQITGKTVYDSIEEANQKAVEIAEKGTTPPLLFGTGTARPNPNGRSDVLAGFSGLVGAVGSNGLIILGFLVVVGLVMVSVRVIRTSVDGADNPIIRSAANARYGKTREGDFFIRRKK